MLQKQKERVTLYGQHASISYKNLSDYILNTYPPPRNYMRKDGSIKNNMIMTSQTVYYVLQS